MGDNSPPSPSSPQNQEMNLFPPHFQLINEKDFIRINHLKIILYANLVCYFIVFRIFISAIGFISTGLFSIALTPLLLFDLLGIYGARKLNFSISLAFAMYLIIALILKSICVLYFSVNLAMGEEAELYTFNLKVLATLLVLFVFEVGLIYVQIKFCEKISKLSPEKSYILERVISGKTFSFWVCGLVKEEVE